MDLIPRYPGNKKGNVRGNDIIVKNILGKSGGNMAVLKTMMLRNNLLLLLRNWIEPKDILSSSRGIKLIYVLHSLQCEAIIFGWGLIFIGLMLLYQNYTMRKDIWADRKNTSVSLCMDNNFQMIHVIG